MRYTRYSPSGVLTFIKSTSCILPHLAASCRILLPAAGLFAGSSCQFSRLECTGLTRCHTPGSPAGSRSSQAQRFCLLCNVPWASMMRTDFQSFTSENWKCQVDGCIVVICCYSYIDTWYNSAIYTWRAWLLAGTTGQQLVIGFYGYCHDLRKAWRLVLNELDEVSAKVCSLDPPVSEMSIRDISRVLEENFTSIHHVLARSRLLRPCESECDAFLGALDLPQRWNCQSCQIVLRV